MVKVSSTYRFRSTVQSLNNKIVKVTGIVDGKILAEITTGKLKKCRVSSFNVEDFTPYMGPKKQKVFVG